MLEQNNVKKILLTGMVVFSVSSCGFFTNNDGNFDFGYSHVADVFKDDGSKDAELATIAYSKGNFGIAEDHVNKALAKNPQNPQALIVGALNAEKQGRTNSARKYYEDLIIYGRNELTVLGSEDGQAHQMISIAKKRLRIISLNQSEFLIENKDGQMMFNISEEAASRQGKTALEEALFIRERSKSFENKAQSEANVKAVEVLFTEGEKNIISRFLTMKELAERDMITKEEFLNARRANIGGLLPLTNQAPALGIDSPVPSPDLLLNRIDALKTAVEDRAITPREFAAERNMIVDAILPANPRARMRNRAPSRDIMQAAKDLRKLEVIYDLGLITQNEMIAERAAIEKSIKTSSGTQAQAKAAVATPPKKAAPAKPLVVVPKTEATVIDSSSSVSSTVKETTSEVKSEVKETSAEAETKVEKGSDTYNAYGETAETAENPKYIEKKVEIRGTMREFPGDPNVSSPF